jgi:phosphoserine phosphatase
VDALERPPPRAAPASGVHRWSWPLDRRRHGVNLETLTREYAIQRRVLCAEARDHATFHELIAMNEGIDEAILAAVRRYMEERDRLAADSAQRDAGTPVA